MEDDNQIMTRIQLKTTCIPVFLAMCFAVDAVVAKQTMQDSVQVAHLLEKGDTMVAQYANEEAISYFEQARELDPDGYQVLSRLSRTYSDYGMDLDSEGDKEGAESYMVQGAEYATRMMEIYPDSARSYFSMIVTEGNLALFKGGKEKVSIGRHVEDYCKKGLLLDPEDSDLNLAYGVFQREIASLSWMERTFARTLFGSLPEGSLDGSEEYLRKALELDADSPLGHFEYALTLITLKRHDEATTHLEKAISLPARSTNDIRNRLVATSILSRLKG